MTKRHKMWSSRHACQLSPLRNIFDLVYYPLCCATNYTQNFLPTGPQHNLVAHPRAMLAGNGVTVDLYLEVLILLGDLLDLLLDLLSDFSYFFHFAP